MVSFTQLMCAATLILGTLAKGHGCRQAKFEPHVSPECNSLHASKQQTLKQGKCHDFEAFYSFKAFRYKAESKVREYKGWNCTVAVFEEKRCRGAYLLLPDLRTHSGLCGNATFDQNGTAPHPGHSAMLMCRPDTRPVPVVSSSTSSLPAYTDIVITEKLRIPVVFSTVSTSSRSSAPSTTKSCSACSTTPKSSSRAASTSTSATTTVRTATIRQTTTIIAPPTATVEGTTTVWVAETTSRKVRTQSYVVTITDAARMKRAMAETSALVVRAMAATETPSLVRRARPDSTECYASIDGHWIVSTCALPSSTSTIAMTSSTLSA